MAVFRRPVMMCCVGVCSEINRMSGDAMPCFTRLSMKQYLAVDGRLCSRDGRTLDGGDGVPCSELRLDHTTSLGSLDAETHSVPRFA